MDSVYLRCGRSRARALRRGCTIVDLDLVELSNLARQCIYRPAGYRRAQGRGGGARWLERELPWRRRRSDTRLRSKRPTRAHLVAGRDFVIDATDSPAAKFLINDTCDGRAASRSVYGGVVGMTGQAMTVIPGSVTACIRCGSLRQRLMTTRSRVAARRESSVRSRGDWRSSGGELSAVRAERPSSREKLRRVPGPARVRIAEINPRPGCGLRRVESRGSRRAQLPANRNCRKGEETRSRENDELLHQSATGRRNAARKDLMGLLHVCETCFGPLEVTYDYART